MACLTIWTQVLMGHQQLDPGKRSSFSQEWLPMKKNFSLVAEPSSLRRRKPVKKSATKSRVWLPSKHLHWGPPREARQDWPKNEI